MLSVLLRSVHFRCWHSLKQFNQSRPEQVEWLKHKYQHNKQLTNKFEYLDGLQKQGRLELFYKGKTLEEIDDLEFYYLLNSQIDFNLNRKGKSELIAQLSSTYFKCLLYREFKTFEEVDQYFLMLSFNEEVASMDAFEVGCCLEVISRFSAVVKKELDQKGLSKAIERYGAVPEQAQNMLVIAGYTSELLSGWKEIITKEMLQFWLKNNRKWDFRSIYFMYKLSEKLEFPIEEATKKLLDRMMSKALLQLEMNQFDSNYLIFLLEYYPEYVQKLNILSFSPEAYLSYLKFYSQNPNNKLKPYKIPLSVLQTTRADVFKSIILLRRSLQLDNVLSIARSFQDYILQNLVPIMGLIHMIYDEKLMDLQIEFYLQRALQHKFHFSEFNPKLFDIYSANDLLNIIANLARMNYGTIDFWKKVTKWCDKFVEYDREKKTIDMSLHNASRLISIISRKNVKQTTRETVYNFTKELLENLETNITIGRLNNLSKSLLDGRIGQDQLWILIEKRSKPWIYKLIKKKEQRTKQENMEDRFAQRKYEVAMMAIAFGAMRKGSFTFWSQINILLDEDDKKMVLNRIIDPLSPAQIYLKFNLQ